MKQPKTLRRSPFVRVYEFNLPELVATIRRGLPPNELARTARALELPSVHIYRMLRLPASTVRRKLAQDKRFSPDHSERILGLQRLIGQVEVMMAESADNAKFFDAAAWVGRWLNEVSPALGNKPPGDFLDTVTGQGVVSNVLAKMQSGAYA